MRSKIQLPVLMILACGPKMPGDPGEVTTTGVSGGTTSTPTTGMSGGTAATAGTGDVTTGSAMAGTTDETSGGAGGTVVPSSDEGMDDPCDVWQQDCRPGEKCAPFSNDGISWDTARCVPVMANAGGVGAPCSAEADGSSGVDDCQLGVYCWDVDPETDEGTCAALCSGAPEAPVCSAETHCVMAFGSALNLCLAQCDPLLTDCGDDGVCVAEPSGEGFVCIPGTGEHLKLHEPCMFDGSCDAGLVCSIWENAAECEEADFSCCEAYCDVTQPNMCPGAGQMCVPWFGPGEAPPGLEDVGFCTV